MCSWRTGRECEREKERRRERLERERQEKERKDREKEIEGKEGDATFISDRNDYPLIIFISFSIPTFPKLFTFALLLFIKFLISE